MPIVTKEQKATIGRRNRKRKFDAIKRGDLTYLHIDPKTGTEIPKDLKGEDFKKAVHNKKIFRGFSFRRIKAKFLAFLGFMFC